MCCVSENSALLSVMLLLTATPLTAVPSVLNNHAVTFDQIVVRSSTEGAVSAEAAS